MPAKNCPMSEEQKRKISLAHLGKKRKPFSLEWRKNLSLARKGKKFTEEHRKNLGKSQMMEKGNNWKGGINIAREGYIYLKTPFHPFANNNSYVKRSRLVMEKMIGRFLSPIEKVHHKGIHFPVESLENRQDDSPENLQLFANQGEHLKSHKLPPPSKECIEKAAQSRRGKAPWNKEKILGKNYYNKHRRTGPPLICGYGVARDKDQ